MIDPVESARQILREHLAKQQHPITPVQPWYEWNAQQGCAQWEVQPRCADCGEPTFHPYLGHDGNCQDDPYGDIGC